MKSNIFFACFMVGMTYSSDDNIIFSSANRPPPGALETQTQMKTMLRSLKNSEEKKVKKEKMKLKGCECVSKTTENARGITIDIALWKFESPKYNFTVIDAPGYRRLIGRRLTLSQPKSSSSYKTGEFMFSMSKNGNDKYDEPCDCGFEPIGIDGEEECNENNCSSGLDFMYYPGGECFCGILQEYDVEVDESGQ